MAMSTLQNTLRSRLSQTPETLTPQIPDGYRFRPDDQELVRFYLYNKITNPHLFTTLSVPVRDSHLFGDQAREPWQIWDSFPKRHGEDLFFFTHLTKKGKNFVRKINRGPGTWHQEYKLPPCIVSIDPNCKVAANRRVFTYHNPKSDQDGSWLISEYSLPSLSQQTVLCRLRKKEVHTTETVQAKTTTEVHTTEIVQATTTTTTTRKRKRSADGTVDEAENPILQNARVEEDHQQPQIMVNGATETVSQVENQQQHLELAPVFDNGVQSDNFESFYCEPPTMQGFENYQMTANSEITSTSNVAPPTVSILNSAQNLRPIDNDEDAAATGDDDFHHEMLRLIDYSGFFDEADGVPSIQATPEADGVQATEIGSTVVESYTSDVTDYHQDSEVSDHSSLSSDAIESFPQALLQANPTCLIQEEEIQMIPNTFYFDCFYGFHVFAPQDEGPV